MVLTRAKNRAQEATGLSIRDDSGSSSFSPGRVQGKTFTTRQNELTNTSKPGGHRWKATASKQSHNQSLLAPTKQARERNHDGSPDQISAPARKTLDQQTVSMVGRDTQTTQGGLVEPQAAETVKETSLSKISETRLFRVLEDLNYSKPLTDHRDINLRLLAKKKRRRERGLWTLMRSFKWGRYNMQRGISTKRLLESFQPRTNAQTLDVNRYKTAARRYEDLKTRQE